MPIERNDALKAIGAILLAISGGIAGYFYQSWDTRPRFRIDYEVPRREAKYTLPQELVAQLIGRKDLIDAMDALVVWRPSAALVFNSWQRSELEDLAEVLKPIEVTVKSQMSSVGDVKRLLSGNPTCRDLFNIVKTRQDVLRGGTPVDLFVSCRKDRPGVVAAQFRDGVDAGAEDTQLYLDTVLRLEKFVDDELHRTNVDGPFVIDIGITNYGQTEGALNNRPVLAVEAPEEFEVVLRVYDRPRPWEKNPVALRFPIITIKGQSFISLTLMPDDIKNTPETMKKLEGRLAPGSAKARIKFLDRDNQPSLISPTFLLKTAAP